MLKRHSEIILSSIDELVANTNLDTLVPQIIANNVFTQDMVNRILVGANGNVEEQSRELFRLIPKRGPQAFSGLVHALLKSGHEKLADMLLHVDGNGTEQMSLSPYPRDTPDSASMNHHCWYSMGTAPFALPRYVLQDLNGGVMPMDSSKKDYVDLQLMMPWTPITVVQADNVKTMTEGSYIEYYPMMAKPRGFALIINNIHFDHYPVRNGAANDEVALKDLLEKLYFEVESHTNKTKHEMDLILEQFAAKQEWSNVDCCWVVIMSHGQEGESEEDTEILGTDGIGLKTRDVLTYFYNDNCPKLRNKPKIFVFQSCRGTLSDPGVKIHVHGEPSPYNYHHRTETDGRPRERALVYDRSRSDMFIAYPVPPGMKANRDRYTGAWFIQSIVTEFARHSYRYELEDLFKIVDRKIRNMINPKDLNHQTVTTRTIGWSKKLFFNPGLSYLNGQLIREIEETEPVSGTDEVDNDQRNKKNQESTTEDDSDDDKKTLCFSCHP